MLVLSRKRGECVMIGNNIGVKVLEIRGERVKLGFECPNDVRVLRDELSSPMIVASSADAQVEASADHPEFA